MQFSQLEFPLIRAVRLPTRTYFAQFRAQVLERSEEERPQEMHDYTGQCGKFCALHCPYLLVTRHTVCACVLR